MPLAKYKWRRSIAVLLCAMLIFSTAFSVTAFADNAVVTSGAMYSYFQTFSSKGQRVDIQTPSHWITGTGEVAYCLQTSNLSDFIFSAIKAIGIIILGWGIVQVGMSIQSHDASQRSQGFLCLFGGLVIAFAKEILAAIGAV